MNKSLASMDIALFTLFRWQMRRRDAYILRAVKACSKHPSVRNIASRSRTSSTYVEQRLWFFASKGLIKRTRVPTPRGRPAYEYAWTERMEAIAPPELPALPRAL